MIRQKPAVIEQERSDGIVDMEVHCTVCQTRLYVPINAIDMVLASLRHVGVAVLVCPNGHAQVVRQEMPCGQTLQA